MLQKAHDAPACLPRLRRLLPPDPPPLSTALVQEAAAPPRVRPWPTGYLTAVPCWRRPCRRAALPSNPPPPPPSLTPARCIGEEKQRLRAHLAAARMLLRIASQSRDSEHFRGSVPPPPHLSESSQASNKKKESSQARALITGLGPLTNKTRAHRHGQPK